MKMLTVFEKGARLRHIGHLDLMRAMQRSLRRSGLPIRYSQGFNPHMLLTFAAPLALGHTGLREMMETPLAEPVREEDFLRILTASLPEDIRPVNAKAVEDTHKSPMALLRAARYQICFPEGNAPAPEALEAFLQRQEIPMLKKTKSGEKTVDLKPMIHECAVHDGKLFATLALTEGASCKPELLLDALYSPLPRPRVLVTRLCLFGEEDGCLVPLEML